MELEREKIWHAHLEEDMHLENKSLEDSRSSTYRSNILSNDGASSRLKGNTNTIWITISDFKISNLKIRNMDVGAKMQDSKKIEHFSVILQLT